MDSSSIVAIASLVMTGAVTLISKYIDSVQKKNEQNMLITSSYIAKKIEAGQMFVAQNNVRIAARLLLRRFLLSLKTYYTNNEQLVKDFSSASDRAHEMSLEKENYWPMYFNVSEEYYENQLIIDKLNDILPLIDPSSSFCSDQNYSQNVGTAIELVDRVLSNHNKMNDMIRADLAKYDTK